MSDNKKEYGIGMYDNTLLTEMSKEALINAVLDLGRENIENDAYRKNRVDRVELVKEQAITVTINKMIDKPVDSWCVVIGTGSAANGRRIYERAELMPYVEELIERL